MTPQELTVSILHLAMEGKLVEQRFEEGSGNDAFSQMQENKRVLLKQKKIKREKQLPDISDDELPHEIPSSWLWIRVGDCGSWSAGATPSRTNSEYYGGDIPWLKTGDLNDGMISEIPEYITDLALEKTSVRLNPVGSVLMAMYGATIGKLGILEIEATTNQACCACIPYEGLYNKYLFYYLMGSRTAFIKMGEGGAQPNISKDKIVNSVIPLPPMDEQKRIVAKIEELLPLIDRYGEAWEKLEVFTKKFPEDMQKSILQMAIQGKLVEQRLEEGTGEELYQQIQEEKKQLIAEKKIKKQKALPEITEDEIPFEIPENWKWIRLSDVCRSITDGDHQAPPQTTQGIPFLVISNVNRGTIDFKNIRHVSKEYFDSLSDDRKAENGDLLFTVTGSYGIPVPVKTDEEFCFQRHIALLKIMVDQDFMTYVLRSPLVKKQCDDTATGTAQKTVGLNSLRSMLVPLPPVEEQKLIVAKLEELLPLCEKLF